MNEVRFYNNINKIFIVSISMAMLIYGSLNFYILTYALSLVLFFLRTLLLPTRRRIRFQMFVLYSLFFVFQVGFVTTIFSEVTTTKLLFAKSLGLIFFLTPLSFESIFLNDDFTKLYFPNMNSITTFSYAFFKENHDELITKLDAVKDFKKGITAKNLKEVITDLPRHGYRSYVNDGSLTEAYFKFAETTLDDPYIYIVLSNTGSGASELISSFTKRNYAHSSISFDSDLKSIISFNGGEKINPPGLNYETLDFFNKKKDSSILVYKLETTKEQKKKMLDYVKTINEEGSAYNIIGIFRIDLNKPNMLVCSQFVYMLLKSVGLDYFEKKPSLVRPTDLIELDYHRKLIFEYELFLNDRK